MKIAIASDDKKAISHHFGAALGFVVFDVKNGKIINKEYRTNIGKNSGECGSCDHAAMIKNVEDCDFVISFGMGRRIYDDLTSNGITPLVTEEETVEDALNQFLKNELKNRTDKLHSCQKLG
jgi:predicted Fe-Mo cluster-binding NifX family protein